MKTELKKISEVKVEMTFSLGKKELAAAEQVALTKLAREVKISGFRKGKAPLEMVSAQVDPAILSQEMMENAVSKAVAEGFLAEKVQVLDRPEVDIKKFVPGELIEFTAEAEVLPEVKLGDYKKLKAKKPAAKVEAKEVSETIDKIRANFAEKKEVKRAAKNGDETLIDFLGKKENVAFEGGEAKAFELILGSNSFIPGFEEGIVGKKAGEEFDLELEFPKEYHSAELAGAKVVFTVNLHEVRENILPEINNEFAAKIGEFKSVSELEKQIEEDLKTQKSNELNEKFKDDLVRALVEISEVPVPEILKKDQMQSIETDMQQNLIYSGLSIEQYLEQMGKTREEWLEGDVSKAAEDRVKAGLALAELSKIENVIATAEELEARISQMKEQYSSNKEAMKQIESEEVRRDIANRMLTEKTVDFLVELNSK